MNAPERCFDESGHDHEIEVMEMGTSIELNHEMDFSMELSHGMDIFVQMNLGMDMIME